MKYYAEISAGKLVDGKGIMVKKSQGSNDMLNISINVDSTKPRYRLHVTKRDDDSTDVVLVDLDKSFPNQVVYEQKIGEKQKGKFVTGCAKCKAGWPKHNCLHERNRYEQ